MSDTGWWEHGEQTCFSPCFCCSGRSSYFQFPAFSHIHTTSFTEPSEKPHTSSRGPSIKDISPLQRMRLMPHLQGQHPLFRSLRLCPHPQDSLWASSFAQPKSLPYTLPWPNHSKIYLSGGVISAFLTEPWLKQWAFTIYSQWPERRNDQHDLNDPSLWCSL